MPYDSISDLPKSVRNSLPQGAQRIYREAFNDAWRQYADPGARKGDASRDETAHKVAWSAVKQKYEKKGDRWVEKN